MAKFFSLLLLAFLFSIASALVATKEDLHIIVIGPTPDSKGLGEDYWQMANKTASTINSCSDVLKDYEIVLERVSIHFPSSVVDFVSVLTEKLTQNKKVVGMVGLVDYTFTHTILPLAERYDITQIIDTIALSLDHDKQNLYTVSPTLEQHVATAIHLFRALNWTKIAIVQTNTDPLYARAAESFIKHSNNTDRPITTSVIDTVCNGPNCTQALNKIQQFSSVKIFLLLLPPEELEVFLCSVYQRVLQWPDSAWVVLSEDPVLSETACNAIQGSSVIQAMEGAIMISRSMNKPDNKLLESSCIVENIHTNPHLSVLHDSMWALTFALNATVHKQSMHSNYSNISAKEIEEHLVDISFSGARRRNVSITPYPFRENTVLSIDQIKSGEKVNIGYFDSKTRQLNVSYNLLGEIPTAYPSTDNYEIFPLQLTALLSTMTVLCILFTTVVLILFIVYRNEPEVKASSVWLSLCMFVGYYFLFTGALSHFIDSGTVVTSSARKYSSCGVTSYSPSIGIDLVLATLLTKVLRIWRIFTVYGKTGKVWTDQVMLLIVGLVISVKIMILVVWAASDTYTLTDVVISTGVRSQTIVQQCKSKMTAIWLVLAYGYSGLLGLSLIAASIKTRKIKQNNFKDTKKISFLICALIYTTVVIGALWGVLRLSGNSTGSKVIIGLAYCIAPILCIVFLLLPKIVPPIQRQCGMRSGNQAAARGRQLLYSGSIVSTTVTSSN